MNSMTIPTLKLRAVERAEKVRESYQRKMHNVTSSSVPVDKPTQRTNQLPVPSAPVGNA